MINATNPFAVLRGHPQRGWPVEEPFVWYMFVLCSGANDFLKLITLTFSHRGWNAAFYGLFCLLIIIIVSSLSYINHTIVILSPLFMKH